MAPSTTTTGGTGVASNLWQRHPAIQRHAREKGRDGDDRTIGQKAADVMRNGMGSWPFIFVFLGLMGIWALANTAFHIGNPPSTGNTKGFDPYPYILLNLILSTLAGLQAAALLIAAKRSDHLASVIALHTEQNTDDLKAGLAQNTDITSATHVNTQLIHLLAHKAGISDAEIAAALRDLPEPGAQH
jgi:uncharacterized membrane protein